MHCDAVDRYNVIKCVLWEIIYKSKSMFISSLPQTDLVLLYKDNFSCSRLFDKNPYASSWVNAIRYLQESYCTNTSHHCLSKPIWTIQYVHSVKVLYWHLSKEGIVVCKRLTVTCTQFRLKSPRGQRCLLCSSFLLAYFTLTKPCDVYVTICGKQ